MANYKKVVEPEIEIPKVEAKPAAVAVEPAAPVSSDAVKKIIVCVGGYNLAAIQDGDTLEISAAGLPASFSIAAVKEGYFPGAFIRRFNVTEHSLDKKALRLKITKQT